MSLKLNSSGGGSVTLLEPNTASALTLDLPAVNGSVVSTGSTAVVTPAMLTQPLTRATAQNTTSGTSIDFTGIPSWVRRITVMFNGVSTNGTAGYLMQLGSSSITASGYSSASVRFGSTNLATNNSTAGFLINTASASETINGNAVFVLVSGNVWVSSSVFASTGQGAFLGGGSVTLGGTLDRIRLTTVNGTDTFDAGSVNIMYEG